MPSSRYPSGAVSLYWGRPVATSASLPITGSITGEIRLVLDTDDLYEWNGSSWERITQNSADVTGPGSSTDNAITRFDGTTGKVIQNSGATIDDSGNITAVGETLSGLTASTVPYSDASKKFASSAVTPTELGYLSGVTSAIQTQIAAKVAKAGDTMTGLLVLSADPSAALGAATKQYVDSVAAGLDVKGSVKCATTANITLSGEQTLDGVLTSASRVLVKNQSAQEENGIYVSGAGAWTRATDMDAWTEVPGAFCFVEEGTLYADTAFVCSADAGGTLGSTAITWSQFAGAGTYTADGQGIELIGTQFGLELDGSTLSKSASGLKVADLGIANAQVAAAAAIARTKLASGNNYRILANDSSGVMSENAAITATRAVASDANGQLVASATTATELGYVNGVTSAIQTQLDAKYCPTSVASVSSNITLTNKRIHLVDTSSARSLALPDPASTHMLVIKDKTGSCSTNNITITRFASEQIETVAASYTLDQDLGSWTFVSDGTDWFII